MTSSKRVCPSGRIACPRLATPVPYTLTLFIPKFLMAYNETRPLLNYVDCEHLVNSKPCNPEPPEPRGIPYSASCSSMCIQYMSISFLFVHIVHCSSPSAMGWPHPHLGYRGNIGHHPVPDDGSSRANHDLGTQWGRCTAIRSRLHSNQWGRDLSQHCRARPRGWGRVHMFGHQQPRLCNGRV